MARGDEDAQQVGQDVHRGPAVLPRQREPCDRLEALLPEVDPESSMHWRAVRHGAQPIASSDVCIVTTDDTAPVADQFHDPFVFLLHCTVDRLWAMWQTTPCLTTYQGCGVGWWQAP